MIPQFQPSVFILDVDGVLSSGQFLYSDQGKAFKVFGADDADALKLLSNHLPIQFVSADHRGFGISNKRVTDDLNFELSLVPSSERIEWIEKRYKLKNVIYMGDGFWDHLIFQKVAYGIAPSNAFFRAKAHAHFVTNHASADRAVAEAVLHIAQCFLPSSGLSEGLS